MLEVKNCLYVYQKSTSEFDICRFDGFDFELSSLRHNFKLTKSSYPAVLITHIPGWTHPLPTLIPMAARRSALNDDRSMIGVKIILSGRGIPSNLPSLIPPFVAPSPVFGSKNYDQQGRSRSRTELRWGHHHPLQHQLLRLPRLRRRVLRDVVQRGQLPRQVRLVQQV